MSRATMILIGFLLGTSFIVLFKTVVQQIRLEQRINRLEKRLREKEGHSQ